MSPDPGLYVHVPFCSAICPYCDFAVTIGRADRLERFVGRLETEIGLLGASAGAFDTLYFGGGTPSLLEADAIPRVVHNLRSRGLLQDRFRLSIEANPEDVSRFRGLKAAGAHTLSLGVQALDDELLRFLGRRHSAREARRSVTHAREIGFDTVSVDLIYGVPAQTEDGWRAQIEEVVSLGVDHLSCYQLTVHEKTMFGRRGVKEPSDSDQASFFRLTHRVLAELGFEGYEISNFARSREHRSAHNQKYWNHVPYRGIGPSAHSFDGRIRSWNERSFFDWERKLVAGEVPVSGSERLSDEALSLETLMLRLRTREGVDVKRYAGRFGIDLGPRAERAVEEGLLTLEDGWLRPSLDGMAVADGLAVALHE